MVNGPWPMADGQTGRWSVVGGRWPIHWMKPLIIHAHTTYTQHIGSIYGAYIEHPPHPRILGRRWWGVSRGPELSHDDDMAPVQVDVGSRQRVP